MSHPLVRNVRHGKGDPSDLYVGREKASTIHFGNPFTHQDKPTLASVIVGSRAEAVQAYRDWLDGKAWADVEPERRLWILDQLPKLKGRRLVCWCAPLACHGDVLAEMAEKS